MSNNPAAAEMDVVGYPFGRGYGVLRGRWLAKGLTKAVALALASYQTSETEILAMVKVEKLDALRVRRLRLASTQVQLKADIERLGEAQDNTSRHRLKLKLASLDRLDVELSEILREETELKAPVTAVVAAPVDEIDALIAELHAACREMDLKGSSTLGAARVIRTIDALRFRGASGNSGTSLRLLVDRMLRLPTSRTDKAIQNAGWFETFQHFARRPGAAAREQREPTSATA